MIEILVLCTGNSCRSQMAEGYLRYFAQDKARIKSAGIEAHGLNPKAVQVMREDGIDISGHTSNLVSEYASINFDYVLTVCDHANEVCPVFPAATTRLHHNFPDPAKALGTEEEILDQFRKVRGQIREYCKSFVENIA